MNLSFLKFFNENHSATIASLVCIGFLYWGYGCESKCQSIIDPSVKVTRAELAIEVDTLIAKAKARSDELDRQDEIKLLSKAEVVKAQCRKVAATGRTNMFDTKAVFKIAMEMGFNELANFISTDTKRYANLILTGELENVE